MSDKNQLPPYVLTYRRISILREPQTEPYISSRIMKKRVESMKEGRDFIATWNRESRIPAVKNPHQSWLYEFISVRKCHA